MEQDNAIIEMFLNSWYYEVSKHNIYSNLTVTIDEISYLHNKLENYNSFILSLDNSLKTKYMDKKTREEMFEWLKNNLDENQTVYFYQFKIYFPTQELLFQFRMLF